jgi:hypothetical protein
MLIGHFSVHIHFINVPTQFGRLLPELLCILKKLFVSLSNQRDAALSSRIYSSLQGYSTCFGCFLRPSSGVQLKL